MEKIILDKVPNDYYYKLLGTGCSGNCFLMKNKLEVFKEFRAQINYLRQLEELSTYKSNIFLFPKKFVFLNTDEDKNFLGYIRNAAKGIEFDSIDESSNFNIILSSMLELEKEMQNLTHQGMLMDDLNQDNLFYEEKNGFNVIDTDFYETTYNDDFKHQYKENLKELSATIIHCLIRYGQFESKELNDAVIKCGAYGNIRPSSLVYEFKEYIRKKTSSEVKTLGDFNKGIELIKVK
ncbi:MAG: hypothetical protein GX758_04135 [Tenericutes bacterium]|nr:hypothetical protein [Mycoplasmatota bacterium]